MQWNSLFVSWQVCITFYYCYGTRTDTSDIPFPAWLDLLRASWLVLGTFVANLWPAPPFHMKERPESRLVTLSNVQFFSFSPCLRRCHVLLGMFTSNHVILVHVQSRKTWCVSIRTLNLCGTESLHGEICPHAFALRTAVRMNGDKPT